MKTKLILALTLLTPTGVMASGATGGTPSTPCYVNGEILHTSVPITACIKGGGSPYQDGRVVKVIQSEQDKDSSALIGYK